MTEITINTAQNVVINFKTDTFGKGVLTFAINLQK